MMASDSFFALAVGGLIALFFGSVLLFGGYRFFLVLLPIWGFVFGFGLGAQTVQALFGDAFLSTATSWVVGFVVAVLFALLSYLFYFIAVGLISGALGYALGVGLLQAIGLDFGLVVWLVGMVVGVVAAVAVLVLNVQKWVVIAATSILGAGVIVGTFLFLFGGLPEAQLVQNPVRVALQASPFWTIGFVLLAVLGAVAQFPSTRRVQLETYDRFAELSGTEPVPADVYGKGEAVIVRAELPGLKKEDVQVTLEGEDLIIRGESKAESEVNDEDYYRMERTFGSFYRRLAVPPGTTAEQIHVSLANGVLEVRIPRPAAAEAEPPAIPVN